MKKLRFLIFFVLLVQLFSFSVLGQSVVQDTVNARLDRANEMKKNDADAAIKLMESTLKFAIKKQDKNSEWKAHKVIGSFYLDNNQYDEALVKFQKSITLAKEMSDARLEALGLIRLAKVYIKLVRFEKSKSTYIKALNIFKELGLKFKEAQAIRNIGNMNTALGLYDEGLENFTQAYEMFDELGEEEMKSRTSHSICYFYLMKNQGESALPYAINSLEYSLKNNKADEIAMGYGNLGYTYSLMGDFKKAFSNYQNGVDTARKYKLTSIEYDTYKDMSVTYEKSGNYSKAMEYQNMYYTLRDSVIGKETLERVSELEVQFETVAQNSEIQELQQKQKIKNLQIILLIIGLSLFGMIGFQIIKKQRGDLLENQEVITKNDKIYRLEKELIEKELREKVLEQEKTEAETKILQQQEIESRHYALALENSNKELEQFAHVVSHDLREPLRMVKSYMGLIRRTLDKEALDRTKEFFYYAIDGADRMDKLITGVLNLAKVQQKELELRPLDLNEIATISIQNLQEFIEEKNAKIHYEGLPQINGDYLQITQLFQNIISNGLKYNTSDKPIVSIEHKIVDQKVELSFSDNGIGIPAEHQDNVFKMFRRLEGNRFSGTGIGLATCQKIIQRHKGNILLESKLGEGTVFIVVLPH